jgi:hypothetical protein
VRLVHDAKAHPARLVEAPEKPAPKPQPKVRGAK